MDANIHLKLDGIDGESVDAGHTKEIDVASWSWGVQNAASNSAGGGGGTGKASFQELNIVSSISKASPAIMLNCANGKHIPKAVLSQKKQGEKPLEFFKIEMEDVLVSSYSVGASGTAGAPVERIGLSFAKMKFIYTPQKKDGSGDAAVEQGWDIKKNEKS